MPFNFERLSVLVVEDMVPMRKLMVTLLESLGVGTVDTATCGKTGFESFCERRQDIIITDWHMEPVSGMDFIEMLRNSPQCPNRLVPIIIMTGYSTLNRVELARDHGVTEYLVKPFSAKDVARRIAYVINKPRDFIETDNYFGPDRRRIHKKAQNAPRRRASD